MPEPVIEMDLNQTSIEVEIEQHSIVNDCDIEVVSPNTTWNVEISTGGGGLSYIYTAGDVVGHGRAEDPITLSEEFVEKVDNKQDQLVAGPGIILDDSNISISNATTSSIGGVIIGSNISVANDGTISVADATNATKGIIEIATDDEAAAETSESLAINPKQLSTKLNKLLEKPTAGTYTKVNINTEGQVVSGSDIVSQDVVTALGYTPYDSSNPAGYITAAEVPAQVNANWTETNPSSAAYIQNKPVIPSAASSGNHISTTTAADGTITINVDDITIAGTDVNVNDSGLTTGKAVAEYVASNPGNYITAAALTDYVPNTRKINGYALTNDVVLTYSDVNALPSSTTINDLTTSAQQAALNSGANTTNITQISTNTTDIATINSKIPSQATSTNQLADKNFVNSSISTQTAYFDGTWPTYAAIPSVLADFVTAGYPAPTNNNYLIVQNDETQDNGTWRYKYVDTGGAYDKSNWHPEYEVNETPMTAAQLAAINSGITSTLVTQITTNQTDIANLQQTSVTASSTNTFTNKSIDAEGTGNNITNLKTTNFKNGVIVTSVGQAGSDTTIPTEKAVRDALTNSISDATITIKQGTTAVGDFTLNQNTSEDIVLYAMQIIDYTAN